MSDNAEARLDQLLGLAGKLVGRPIGRAERFADRTPYWRLAYHHDKPGSVVNYEHVLAWHRFKLGDIPKCPTKKEIRERLYPGPQLTLI